MTVIVGVAFAVVVLYLAQDVLLPLTLALLLSFVLSPLAARLERWGLGRIASVIATVSLAFALLSGVGWVVTDQLMELTQRLPTYKDTVIAKIRALRGPLGDGSGALTSLVQELNTELAQATGGTPAAGAGGPGGPAPGQRPVPVQIVETAPFPLRLLRDWLGPVLTPLGTAALVLVFVIFILLQREDLRDRFIRLAGTRRVYVTTQALDEAGSRVSQYLLMQLIINATYGIAVALGLLVIGLPNAFLWGLLAAGLRFVPYVGPWIAALLPLALSLAVFDGWTSTAATLGLFLALELVSNNVMEPWLYGASTGVSVVGIIVAASFWTWLWGPIGLVLSMPLTVCLVVVGRYVPQLNFLNVLLSDEPALELSVRFYQRLLAFDEHEAQDVASSFLRTGSLDDLYERMLIPALSFSERDRQEGHLTENQQRFLHRTVQELITDLGQQFAMAGAQNAVPAGAAEAVAATEPAAGTRRALRLLCVPAQDEADRLAGRMVAQLLAARGHGADTLPVRAVSDELPDLVARHRAEVVVISALAPGGAAEAREGCRRLRARCPALKIVVGLWHVRGLSSQATERLTGAGADVVTSSLSESVTRIQQFAHPVAVVTTPVQAGPPQTEADRHMRDWARDTKV